MQTIKEYFAKAKAKKTKRAAKRKELIKTGQLSGMPWTYWRDKADEMWSKCIALMAKVLNEPYCPTCSYGNKNIATVACHKVPRTFYGTRFLLANGYFGCSKCNYSEKMNRGISWNERFDEVFGIEQMTHLRGNASAFKKLGLRYDRGQMRGIYENIKNEYEKLHNGSRSLK